jgi:hypothetical protein
MAYKIPPPRTAPPVPNKSQAETCRGLEPRDPVELKNLVFCLIYREFRPLVGIPVNSLALVETCSRQGDRLAKGSIGFMILEG